MKAVNENMSGRITLTKADLAMNTIYEKVNNRVQ